jgi:hypothetical protein
MGRHEKAIYKCREYIGLGGEEAKVFGDLLAEMIKAGTISEVNEGMIRDQVELEKALIAETQIERLTERLGEYEKMIRKGMYDTT